MISEYWIIILAAAGLALAFCLVLMPLAQHYHLLDHPSARKVHHKPIPLAGGPAIFLSLLLVSLLATPYGAEAWPLLLASALMLFTGLRDDLHELAPRTRFGLQIAACLIMIYVSGVVLTDFGSLLWNGVLPLGWLSVPITIFAALGVINAFNMMDGIDGLSAMVFIVAGSAMAWLALAAGQGFNATVLMIAVGAVAGFFLLNAHLPWNRRARVFLGDSGSMFLGLLLAWQFIELGSGDARAFSPVTAVWLLGIPLLDTMRLMKRRWRLGGSALKADQFHLHHAFLKAGFSVTQTVIAITLLVLFTTAIGLAGQVLGWPEYLMFYGYAAFAVVYLRIMRHCWRDGRFLGRRVSMEIAS